LTTQNALFTACSDRQSDNYVGLVQKFLNETFAFFKFIFNAMTIYTILIEYQSYL